MDRVIMEVRAQQPCGLLSVRRQVAGLDGELGERICRTLVQAVCVRCGGAYAVTAKDDDFFQDCPIICCLNRLRPDRSLCGEGKQQTYQPCFKGNSGHSFSALGWFGFDIWSDWIHGC